MMQEIESVPILNLVDDCILSIFNHLDDIELIQVGAIHRDLRDLAYDRLNRREQSRMIKSVIESETLDFDLWDFQTRFDKYPFSEFERTLKCTQNLVKEIKVNFLRIEKSCPDDKQHTELILEALRKHVPPSKHLTKLALHWITLRSPFNADRFSGLFQNLTSFEVTLTCIGLNFENFLEMIGLMPKLEKISVTLDDAFSVEKRCTFNRFELKNLREIHLDRLDETAPMLMRRLKNPQTIQTLTIGSSPTNDPEVLNCLRDLRNLKYLNVVTYSDWLVDEILDSFNDWFLELENFRFHGFSDVTSNGLIRFVRNAPALRSLYFVVEPHVDINPHFYHQLVDICESRKNQLKCSLFAKVIPPAVSELLDENSDVQLRTYPQQYIRYFEDLEMVWP